MLHQNQCLDEHRWFETTITSRQWELLVDMLSKLHRLHQLGYRQQSRTGGQLVICGGEFVG